MEKFEKLRLGQEAGLVFISFDEIQMYFIKLNPTSP